MKTVAINGTEYSAKDIRDVRTELMRLQGHCAKVGQIGWSIVLQVSADMLAILATQLESNDAKNVSSQQ